MYKYFTANQTRTYIDVLPEMVGKYNCTKYRSIGMTHIQASDAKNSNIYLNLYKRMPEKTAPKFSVGDQVMIKKKKGVFDKGYTSNGLESSLKSRGCKIPTHLLIKFKT